MTDPVLVLYEIVDIVGQGQYEYMEHVRREPVQQMPSMMKLQGSFFVCAAGGGRWPQCVNVWDVIDGWEGWGRNVDRLNLKRRAAFYGDWWDQAAQWRTGGFDRLCAGAPGCPTTADIAAAGTQGTLFVNELLTVRPGTQREYLAAVVEEQQPVWADHGHHLVGLYEVTSNRHEVVVLWATDVDDQVALRRSGDERLARWDQVATGYVTGGDTHLMTPLPGTVYGPADWEAADLAGWLEPDR